MHLQQLHNQSACQDMLNVRYNSSTAIHPMMKITESNHTKLNNYELVSQ